MNIDEKVLSLDLGNLTQAQIDWLHELRSRAQHIKNAEFRKSIGIGIEIQWSHDHADLDGAGPL